MTCRNEKCLSLLHRTLVALFHLVTKEHLVLIRGAAPAFKESQISIGWADQVEDLLTLKEKRYHTKGFKKSPEKRGVPKDQISLSHAPQPEAVCQSCFPDFISFF